jgi:hypothetical protein
MFNFNIKQDDLICGDKFKSISNVKFIKIDDALNYIKNNKSIVNIVSHNGDYSVDDKYCAYENNFPKWFGQNITNKSNKFYPIPIGLENDYVPNSIEKKKLLINFSNNYETVPYKLLYINHNIGTNPNERIIPYKMFESNDFVTVEHSGGFAYQENYYKNIMNHHFVLSPPGNGIDCHRTWEILYLKRIPIVKRVGRLEELYKDLPVLFINDYSEISKFYLKNFLNKISDQSFNFDKIKFSYWKSFVAS